jgi:hypothetical protein
MRDHRGGGTFFWDRRDHFGTIASAWSPMMNYGVPYIYRFRTNQSFPAFSNCSYDGNPANGTATDGDSIGTINGFLDWNPAITDEPARWVVGLMLHDLASSWGPVVAPESLTVDVTPRRMQSFTVSPWASYAYTVARPHAGGVVQSGTLSADGLGVLTVPAVRVFRRGSVLTIQFSAETGVTEQPAPGTPRPIIAPVPSPLSWPCALEVTWARDGDAAIDLVDLAGRRVKREWRGRVVAGRQRSRLELTGVPSGAYAIVAHEGDAVASRRIVVLR